MSKKMINMNERAETVLAFCKNGGGNLSALVSDSVTNYVLPQYGSLHTEALYLLDTISNDLRDWRGPGGSRIVPDEPSAAACAAVRRAVSWLRGNHVRNASVIRLILSHYDTSEKSGTYTGDDDAMLSRIATYALRLGMNDSDNVRLGILVKALLDSWESVWDDPDVYEILIRFIYLEEPSVPFEPFEALDIMRMIEQTYIMEQITE